MKYEEDRLICGSCGSDKVAEMSYTDSNTEELVLCLDQTTYPEHFYICYNDNCDEEFIEELTSYTSEVQK